MEDMLISIALFVTDIFNDSLLWQHLGGTY